MQATTITRDHLAEIFSSLKRPTFVTLTTKTDPKPLKKHRDTKEPLPYPGMTKATRLNVAIGTNYEAAVNRQHEREDTGCVFFAHERKWGRRLPGTPLVEHNGRKYLECQCLRVYGVAYHDAAGNLLDASNLAGYLPIKSSNHQGIENEVVIRDYALDSIVEISMDGEHYDVVG